MQDRSAFELPVTGTHNETQNADYNRLRQALPAIIRFLLIAGLGFLSWLATYSGLTELIEANGREIGPGYTIAMALAVALLTLMIVYLLDSIFSPINLWLKILYAGGYVFLSIISIGFGFGFYWDFIEARSETTRTAIATIQKIENSLKQGDIQLEQLQLTFDGLMAISAENAELERTVGQTCPNSPPGDGPRRRLRETDGRNFKFASEFVRKRSRFIHRDLAKLNTHLSRVQAQARTLATNSYVARVALYKDINKQISHTLTRYNSFRKDPQLLQLRDSFRKRAKKVNFDDGRGGTFYCPDPQLKIALLGAVRSIDELPVIHAHTINSVEGPEALKEAFRRLTASILNVIPLSNTSSEKTEQFSGMTERDYLPLLIALFVDLCILLISVNRPVNRLQFFLNNARRAHNTQMHEILRRFHDVHDSRRSGRLDVFHDVMFDIGTELYAAVPIDLRNHSEPGEEFYEFSQRSMQARYLATLMVALEEAGLVSRSHYVSERKARRLLKKLKSPYAHSPGFRVYKFSKGAWPAIILDDILGEARKMENGQKLLPPPAPNVTEDIPYQKAIYEECVNANNQQSAPEQHPESLIRIEENRETIHENINEKKSVPENTIASNDNCKVNKSLEDEVMKLLSAEINFHEEHHIEEEVPAEIEINKIARQFAHVRTSAPDEKVE